jgi:predicted nucleotidyltransferase component of viral defense system
MILHNDKEVFHDAIVKTSEMFSIREIYIEKDYWVTYALKTVFGSPIGKECVFKGGTALSKCFNLIDRFSEDIDLVILNKPEDTGGQLKKKLKAVSEVIGSVLKEIDVDGITNKKGQVRKIAYEYDRICTGEFGQIRDKIILESSIFGFYEPSSDEFVSSFIADMIKESGLDYLLDKYEMHPFKVRVLSKLRTFCEKIMSLVKFSHTENAYEDLSNKIRHFYDLHNMLKDEEVLTFLEGDDFDDMLIRVGKDDKDKYKNNAEWIDIHPSESIVFSDVEDCWGKISGSYKTSFSEMVYGELPQEKIIIESLKKISKRINRVDWNLQ